MQAVFRVVLTVEVEPKDQDQAAAIGDILAAQLEKVQLPRSLPNPSINVCQVERVV